MKRVLKQNFDYWVQLKMMKKAQNSENAESTLPEMSNRDTKTKNFSNKNADGNSQSNIAETDKFSKKKEPDIENYSEIKDPNFRSLSVCRIDFEIKTSESPALSHTKSSLTTQSVAGFFIRRVK